MLFIYAGVILIVLKLLEAQGFSDLSWFIIAIPFVLAIIWWELIEPMFGFDRRSAEKDPIEVARRKRIKESWKKKK